MNKPFLSFYFPLYPSFLSQSLHCVSFNCADKSGGGVNFVVSNKCSVVDLFNFVSKMAEKLLGNGIDNEDFGKLGVVSEFPDGCMAEDRCFEQTEGVHKVQATHGMNRQRHASFGRANKLAGIGPFVGCYLKALALADAECRKIGVLDLGCLKILLFARPFDCLEALFACKQHTEKVEKYCK